MKVSFHPSPATDASSEGSAPLSPVIDIRMAHLLDGRHFGGAEQMVRRLTEAAPRYGIQAWVYCLAEGRLAQYLNEAKVPLRVFPSSGRFDFRPLRDLARSIRQDSIQLIQAHTSRTHLFARLLSRRLHIPNITTIQSPIAQDENRGFGRHPLRSWVERLGRPWTDHITPVSREETERLIQDERVPRDKLTWIPNGLEPTTSLDRQADRDRLRQWLIGRDLASDLFTMVMIAQMRPRKGPEVILRAFAHWWKQGGRGLLLMIGDDEMTAGEDYLDRLKSEVTQLGIDRFVHFLGFQLDPWALAAGADLLVLPSLFGEGLPLVLLEAMNYGLPIATSDIPGNREVVIAGRTGWLHSPDDDVALARHLAEAAADPAATAKRGLAGRDLFLERYTLQAVMGQYLGLYERLLQTS